MLYFRLDHAGAVNAVTSDHRDTRAEGEQWVSRWDFKGLDDAQFLADQATALTGHRHIATDAGPHTSPRYDVIRCPAVGEAVSYAFNGDSYPDGFITSVSPSLKVITTSTGNRYYRRKQKGAWCRDGRTWWLILGHHNDRNPHI